jgi:hypothetical protein
MEKLNSEESSPFPEIQEWLEKQKSKTLELINPLVKMFGRGPDGAICRTCAHLYRKQFSRVYIRCDLRPNTNGPGTDHKARWPACGKYQPTTTTKGTNEKESKAVIQAG